MSFPALPDSSREELTYRLRQEQLTSEFGLYCVRSPSRGDLLQEATRASAEGLQCGFAKVLEPDPARKDFLVIAGVGWRDGVVGHARIGGGTDSPAGYAMESCKPITSNHLSTERRFRTPALLVEHGIRSAINVIIRGDRDAFGVLEVDSSHKGRFTEADSAFLQGFANLLGVAIELKHKEQQLQQALDHEKVLVQEVHHRVKNSLALVAGLLTLQRRGSADDTLRAALEDAEQRIYAVAQVHDHLANHGHGRVAPLDAFVGGLCAHLASAHPRHRLVWNVVSLAVSADRAITLGLLINELVTNAFKYAYLESGEVRVSIQRVGDNELLLDVSDDGVGMPQETEINSKGLGTKVVTSLARQLGGGVVWHRDWPGTHVTLRFNLEPVEQSS